MGFLIDTNALSELRKGARMDANVRRWFDIVKSEDIYLTLVTRNVRDVARTGAVVMNPFEAEE